MILIIPTNLVCIFQSKDILLNNPHTLLQVWKSTLIHNTSINPQNPFTLSSTATAISGHSFSSHILSLCLPFMLTVFQEYMTFFFFCRVNINMGLSSFSSQLCFLGRETTDIILCSLEFHI